jgi:prefoldin alpha subunit
MSGAPEPVTEDQVQDDLMRLEAYRNQLQAIVQQHDLLTASRAEHQRARESLDGIDGADAASEYLVPLGGELFVRGTVAKGTPVLLGIGSGVVVELDRAKAAETVSERTGKIEQALRDLEGQAAALDERIQLLSRRLDSLSRGAAGSPNVGRA